MNKFWKIRKNDKKAIMLVIGSLVLVLLVGLISLIGLPRQIEEKRTEQKKWQAFTWNLEEINYQPPGIIMGQLVDKKDIWQPGVEDFKEIYKYVYGENLVAWQKLDGTDMSPLVDGVDEQGRPMKIRTNLIPHWQQEYNRAIEIGEMKGDIIKTLRDGVRKREVNGDGIKIDKTANIGRRYKLDWKELIAGFFESLIKTAYAAIVFNDTFIETSDTAVESHTPDTGDSWTEGIEIGTCAMYIEADVDQIQGLASRTAGGCGDSEGQMTTADVTLGSADYNVSIDQVNGDTVDDVNYLYCRYQNASNFYVLKWNEEDYNLWKQVSDSWTKIASGSGGIADGSTVVLKCQGTSITVEDDGVEILSATDSDISAAGKAGYGMGALYEPDATDDVSNQTMDNFQVDGTGGNSSPTISGVTDTPDPVIVGSEIAFATTWSDEDAGDVVKVKICKTDVLANQNCTGGFWASSTDFTATTPTTTKYLAQSGDVATSPNNYFAYVCDDDAACVASGSGTSGTFSVNATPGSPAVTDTPDPTNPYRSVSFIVDWDDSGDSVKAKVCKTDSLTSQNCDDGSWASSTAFTTTDPLRLKYDIAEADWGQTRNYYVFTCDDDGLCSGSDSGSFSVNSVSTVPNIDVRGGVDIR